VGARDDEARDDEPLAELRLERHRDLVGRHRETWARRILTAVFFFLLPYLVTGLLLLFADLGVSAAAPLWSKTRRRKARAIASRASPTRARPCALWC